MKTVNKYILILVLSIPFALMGCLEEESNNVSCSATELSTINVGTDASVDFDVTSISYQSQITASSCHHLAAGTSASGTLNRVQRIGQDVTFTDTNNSSETAPMGVQSQTAVLGLCTLTLTQNIEADVPNSTLKVTTTVGYEGDCIDYMVSISGYNILGALILP